MKRLKTNLLTQRNGLYVHDGELFSGVGFESGDNQTVRGSQFQSGLRTGPYHPICAMGADVPLQVEFANGIEPYVTTMYQGRPFSGIAYTFEEGRCRYECLFREGIEVSEAWWLKDGTMTSYNLDNGEFGEGYEWYPNGKLKSAGVSTNHSFVGRFSFTEDGLLKFLSLQRGFLNRLTEIRSKVKFLPISIPIAKTEDLGRLRAAPETILSGDEISDDLLQLMAKSGSFDKTAKLQILRTPKIESLALLAKLPNLTEVVLEEIGPNQVLLAKSLKQARPALHIVLNRSDVAA